jgi:hypothetical protein
VSMFDACAKNTGPCTPSSNAAFNGVLDCLAGNFCAGSCS